LVEDTMTPRQREIFIHFLKKETLELFHHRDFSVLAILPHPSLPLGERKKMG